MMVDTTSSGSAARLKRAFEDLQAGRLEAAARDFAALSGEAATAVEARRGLAAVTWRLGQTPKAVELLRQATRMDPRNAEAQADLALMMTVSRQGEAALPEWERALALQPDNADVWHNYAKQLGDLRHFQRSHEAFERSLKLAPDRLHTLCAYARMLAASGNTDASETLWRRVLALAPAAADGYQGLAELEFLRGRIERALEVYREGTAAVPDSADLQMGFAQVLEDLADRDGAERAFRRALELRPGWPLALEGLLTLIRGKAEPALIAEARAIVEDSRRPPPDRANVGFGLGKALDAQSRHEEAFTVWRLANQARRAQVGAHDRDAVVQFVDRSRATFTPERMARLAGAGSPDQRPVFVLGMPRSGTTLVEQIIAAHPQARGLGELPDFGRIARDLPRRAGSIQRWPEALEALTPPVLQAAAQDYLRALEQRGIGGALRVVDKAPFNFLHVGAIRLLFPQARIVWCRRDPRDIGLSIYAENFSLEQKFASDLGDLGHYFREHMRLMRHWSALLPGVMHECVYEALVAEPEREARALIAAVGLPWDPACLRFHEQTRPVLTPSRWQVRQPMYASSAARWTRYAQWLGPLIEALGDEVPA